MGGSNGGPAGVGDVGFLLGSFFRKGPSYSKRKEILGIAAEGWPGSWYVRLVANYKAFGWLTLNGQVVYFGDTVKNENAFEGATSRDYDHESIGLEFDWVPR